MKANVKKLALLAVLLVGLVSVVAVALFIANSMNSDDFWGDGSDSGATMNAIYIDGEKYYPRIGVRNYLIMGIDRNEERDGRGNADFLMILSFDLNAETYDIIYINRDTMIEVDQYSTDWKKTGTRVEQIALSHGGGESEPSNRRKCENTELSVSRLFKGMEFDGYMSMTMDAVEVMVDLIGGVEVLVEDDMRTVDERLAKGERVMLDGELALKFVRARGGLEDSTNPARMNRQEAFLEAFFTKIEEEVPESSLPDIYEEVSPMLVSNLDIDNTGMGYLELFERLATFEKRESISVGGEYKMGEKFWEFYASEESIISILTGKLYEKAY